MQIHKGRLNFGSVTEMQFVDPLSFKTINVGDRVTVTAPTGAVVDFIVNGIGEDETIVLGPLKMRSKRRSIAYLESVVLAASYNRSKNDFRVEPKEIVTVTDHRGRSTRMRIDFIVNKDLLVLERIDHKPKLSFFDKLKFAWKIMWK